MYGHYTLLIVWTLHTSHCLDTAYYSLSVQCTLLNVLALHTIHCLDTARYTLYGNGTLSGHCKLINVWTLHSAHCMDTAHFSLSGQQQQLSSELARRDMISGFYCIPLPQQSLNRELPQLLTLPQPDAHKMIDVIDLNTYICLNK